MVEQLLQQLLEDGSFKIGELTVERIDRGFTVSGPKSDRESSQEIDCEPGAIHRKVRFDDIGRYRPMYSAKTMPSNWRLHCETSVELAQSLATIYPLALEHIAAYRQESLPVLPIEQVLNRQSGRYSRAAELNERGREVAGQTLCGQCIRTPIWRGEQLTESSVPCPEACSLMVALCREAAVWQSDPPNPVEVNPTIDFAAFDQPGNEIRKTYLSSAGPLNIL